MGATGFEIADENTISGAPDAGSAIPSPSPSSETARASQASADTSRDPKNREAKPLTLDVLRAKLDAAIVAEAWDAVKAINERIKEREREGVVDLDERRQRRR